MAIQTPRKRRSSCIFTGVNPHWHHEGWHVHAAQTRLGAPAAVSNSSPAELSDAVRRVSQLADQRNARTLSGPFSSRPSSPAAFPDALPSPVSRSRVFRHATGASITIGFPIVGERDGSVPNSSDVPPVGTRLMRMRKSAARDSDLRERRSGQCRPFDGSPPIDTLYVDHIIL